VEAPQGRGQQCQGGRQDGDSEQQRGCPYAKEVAGTAVQPTVPLSAVPTVRAVSSACSTAVSWKAQRTLWRMRGAIGESGEGEAGLWLCLSPHHPDPLISWEPVQIPQ
jgi:hypothetical protein